MVVDNNVTRRINTSEKDGVDLDVIRLEMKEMLTILRMIKLKTMKTERLRFRIGLIGWRVGLEDLIKTP